MMKKEIFKKKDKTGRNIMNKSRGKKKKIVAATCAMLLLAGGICGAIYKSQSGGEKVKAATQMSAQAQVGDVSTTISSSGSLEGKEASVVQIPAGIKIKEVLVSEGDGVRKGTKLASIYPASVAEVLLEVKESIDTVESSLEDLDEDEIADTTSEDYLKKLTYDQELAELEDLEDQLQDMLETGYIQAETAGLVGTINVADDTVAGTTSTDTSSSETIGTGYGAGAMVSGGKSVSAILLSAFADIISDGTETDSSETSAATQSASDSSEESSEKNAEETTETESEDSSEEESKDSADSTSSAEEDTGSKSSADTSSKQTSGNKGTTTETKNSSTDQSSGTRNASGRQGGAAAGNAAASGQSSSATSAETTAESDTIADIEMVNAFVLNSNSQMLVTVSVDEADIGSVQEGQSAQVTITALSEETFQGEISGISNVSSSSGSSVKYEVEITIDKADGMLTGMSASATIYIDQAENVVTIPSAAVQEKGGKAYVYTQKDSDGNLSGETEVTTGLSDGNQVEIKEGLSEGDTVYYEVYSSNNSENGSKEMNFDKMGDFGGNHNGGNGGPGNPPSGSPDRSN